MQIGTSGPKNFKKINFWGQEVIGQGQTTPKLDLQTWRNYPFARTGFLVQLLSRVNTTMLTRDIAILSVCPSRFGTGSKRLRHSDNFFTVWSSNLASFMITKHFCEILTGLLLVGVLNTSGVYKISRFSTNNSLYLANNTR